MNRIAVYSFAGFAVGTILAVYLIGAAVVHTLLVVGVWTAFGAAAGLLDRAAREPETEPELGTPCTSKGCTARAVRRIEYRSGLSYLVCRDCAAELVAVSPDVAISRPFVVG